MRGVDCEPGARPTSQGLPYQMSLFYRLCIHVSQNMLGIFRDLVRLLRLIGIDVYEDVNGVKQKSRAHVGHDVAGERLQMTARAVQHDDVITSAGSQRS